MEQAATTFPFSRFVESVRFTSRAVGRARRVDRLPDGRTALVFRALAPECGDVTIVGPRTHALLKDATGFAYAVSFDLEPGWSRALLGVAANELTDAHVRLQDLWGRAGHELSFDLLAANTEMIDHVSRAFARRRDRGTEPTSARLARRAARLLEQDGARVENVAQQLGVTARHLRRAFAENIGITPKELARAARLQLAAASDDWGASLPTPATTTRRI